MGRPPAPSDERVDGALRIAHRDAPCGRIDRDAAARPGRDPRTVPTGRRARRLHRRTCSSSPRVNEQPAVARRGGRDHLLGVTHPGDLGLLARAQIERAHRPVARAGVERLPVGREDETLETGLAPRVARPERVTDRLHRRRVPRPSRAVTAPGHQRLGRSGRRPAPTRRRRGGPDTPPEPLTRRRPTSTTTSPVPLPATSRLPSGLNATLRMSPPSSVPGRCRLARRRRRRARRR